MEVKNRFSSLDVWTRLFLLSFCCVALLSFSNIERSYSPLKYNGPVGMDDLLYHYNGYKTSFKIFVSNTYIFHEGDTEGSKRGFFFLWPLFIGVDLMGGLNFANMYRVTIIFGLFSILVLFIFLKSYWNAPIAFLSCLFYGFSPWFQELFRQETYHGPTVLILLLILYATFNFEKKEYHDCRLMLPFVLGVLVGVSYYFYGLIRGIILLAVLVILTKKDNRLRNFSLFSLGLFLVLGWGIYLRLIKGGVFFDDENFLIDPQPWISLLKRTFLIVDQISSPYVTQAVPSSYVTHSRLLHPFLFLPFIVGFCVSILQKQKNYRLLNLCSLILYLSILITSNYQVRRLTLLIIPVYTYTGVGIFYIYTYLRKKDIGQRSKIKVLGAILIFCIVLSQLIYIQNNIFKPDRTFGFLRVAQEIKRRNIQGEVLLLMDDAPRMIHEVKDEIFIKIENYKKIAMGKMRVRTIAYYTLQGILSNQNIPRLCLIIAPLVEGGIIESWVKEYGYNISHEGKIDVSPALKRLEEDAPWELKANYFKILEIEYQRQ